MITKRNDLLSKKVIQSLKNIEYEDFMSRAL